MSNRSVKSGHPRLVPDLRGKAVSISPLSITFAVGFLIWLKSICFTNEKTGSEK